MHGRPAGVRCFERRASRGTPRTEETASWIAATEGAIGRRGHGGHRRFRARRAPAPRPASGSSNTDETARTRVSAPSSRRTLPGTRVAIVRRTSGSGSWSTASPAKRQSSAIRVRRSGGSTSTVRPQSKRSRSRCSSRSRDPGGPVAGEHDLLAGGEQRVEGVDELLLGPRLALEELDVVDQQRVEPAVALLEALRPLGAQRRHELAGEALGGRVVEGEGRGGGRGSSPRSRPRRCVLPEPGRAVEEERVVGLAGELGHRQRCRVGEAVAGADHEAVEGVRRVDRQGLGDRLRARRLGLGALPRRPPGRSARTGWRAAGASPRADRGSAARPRCEPAPGPSDTGSRRCRR